MLEDYNQTKEKVIGKHWGLFLSMDSTLENKIDNIKEIVLKKKNVWKGELSDTAKDGKILWRQVSVFPIQDKVGNIIRFVYMSDNITEEKNIKDLLRVQRDFSFALGDKISLAEVMGEILDSAIKMEGIDSGGIYIRNVETGDLDLLLHKGLPADFIKISSHYDGNSPQAKLVAKGDPVHVHYEQLKIKVSVEHKKEPIKAISIIPIKYEKKVIAVLNLASHTHDVFPVTTREAIESFSGIVGGSIIRAKAELALKESEERYRNLVNVSPDVIIILHDMQFKFVNSVFKEKFGYTKKEVYKGLTFLDLITEHDKDRAAKKYNDRVAGKTKSNIFQVDFEAKNGKIIPCEISSIVIQYEGTPAVLASVRDITGRKKAEIEKDKLEKQLRQAEKMEAVGQLAGGIAHDFNNQLALMLGYADILKEELAEDINLANYVDKIILGITRGVDLTSQLLAFARKGKYIIVPVDMHRIIFEVISLLKHSIDRKIILKQHLNAGVSMILGDSSQLQNALLNLALNARDAMPNGGEFIFSTNVVILDEEYCSHNPYKILPGRYLKITAEDNGTGMDEEVLSHVFEPFFTTKKTGKGTGMGLAAVYGTVKNHKGSIDVKSTPGKSTVFKLYFPVYETSVRKKNINLSNDKAVHGKASILIVDDEEYICKITSSMLERLGYDVVFCYNGKQAIEYYYNEWKKIDLVILDMVMPEMNGKETYYAMKKINPELKVIIASGYSIDNDAQDILKHGSSGFIQKPFRKGDLSRTVAKVLGIRKKK